MRVENVQRQKIAAHNTNTKNFWFCAPTHCPTPTSPYGQLITASGEHQKTYKGNDDWISTLYSTDGISHELFSTTKKKNSDAPYHTSCNDVFVAA